MLTITLKSVSIKYIQNLQCTWRDPLTAMKNVLLFCEIQ